MMKNIPCNLMSFDTSTTSSGWALFTNAKLEQHGILKQEGKNSEASQKINLMIKDLITSLNKYNPLIVVIEKPPYKSDPKALTALAEIIGAIRGWAVMHNADYVEYMPNEWRALIANENEKIPLKREAAKAWDLQKIKDIFGIDISEDDEADGILIGYARIIEFSNWMKSGICK